MIKKYVTILSLGIFISTSAFADSIPDIMRQMEADTVKILKGFLRDKNQLVIEGARDIKNHPDISKDIFKYVKKERRTPAFKKFVLEFDKLVRKEAGLIEEYIKEGNKGKASEHFAKLLDRCNGCHAVFRGW